MFVLRDVEKFAGCIRVSIIYIGSGIIGNLASAIFLPYQAEVGPFSCHVGIVACLYVEMFHARKYYVSPWLAALKTSIIILVILLIGFLPMIDNFANVFGFIGGLLLSIIVFPNVDLIEKCKRVLIIVVTTVLFTALAATLIILFYIKPIDKCDFCKLLSCPFSKKFCLDMDFDITRIRNTKI
jgi:membrane associated rhomboid family serine protease